MHTDPTRDPGAEPNENPEVAFEKRDLGARGILVFFAVLFIAGAAIHLVVLGLYTAFSSMESHQAAVNPMAPRQPAPTPGVLQNAGDVNLQQFPEPRLQSDEPADMSRFLQQEQQVLDAKPWRDQAGAIHIPVDEAMQIVAQKGLPVRQQPGAQAASQLDGR